MLCVRYVVNKRIKIFVVMELCIWEIDRLIDNINIDIREKEWERMSENYKCDVGYYYCVIWLRMISGCFWVGFL